MSKSIKDYIRTVPDFPKSGIMFRDVTTLFGNKEGFKLALDQLEAAVADLQIDVVAGIDARGFIIGGALADRLALGFVPIRKKGKLPAETIEENYALEYGSAALELHKDAFKQGQDILLVDDLIATGGTAKAACDLVKRIGGNVAACAFLVDLPDLGGSTSLKKVGHKAISLCEYAGD
jgi:adenine phosphoribosyltransferase